MTSFGSGQTSYRALTGSGQNPGRVLTGSGQKFGSGSGRVRDDVSMTSASGLTGSKTDRGRDWVGHVTSANQLGFRSGVCPSRTVVLNARGGA